MALSTLPDQLEKANPDESDKLFNDVYGSDVARGINELEQHANSPTGDKKSVQDQEAASERSERGI